MGSEAVSLVENSRSTAQSVMSAARQTGRFQPCDPSGRLVAPALSPPFSPLDTCAPGALRCSASAKGDSPHFLNRYPPRLRRRSYYISRKSPILG